MTNKLLWINKKEKLIEKQFIISKKINQKISKTQLSESQKINSERPTVDRKFKK